MTRLAALLFAVGVALTSAPIRVNATVAPPVAHACPMDLTGWKNALGAEWIACVHLDDLTTTGNPYTDPNDLYGMGFPPPGSGTLNSHYVHPTSPAVPGVQIHGYFPGGCSNFVAEPALTAKNGAPFMPGCTPPPFVRGTCVSACHHDGEFVLRIPDAWEGHLLTAGTPGIRDAFASDFVMSDYALEKGWAYVAHDKGSIGSNFFQDSCDLRGTCTGQPTWPGACSTAGEPWCAGDVGLEWAFRMRQATRAARQLLSTVAPGYALSGVSWSYAAGISNGGYQTRRALETDTGSRKLYDGGLDWEGTLFLPSLPPGVRPATPATAFNLFGYLPTALANAPGDITGNPVAISNLAAVGFNPESQPLWPYHWSIYWGLTQKAYRLAFDPEYTAYSCSDVTGVDPPCVVPPVLGVASTDADARYNYAARVTQNPALVQRLASIANTGDIQHPLITVHGDQDALLPIKTDSDLYAQMVQSARYRYYTVRGGNHVDGQFDDHYGVDTYGNTLLRPIQPCARAALDALVAWVELGATPPPSHTIARPSNASADQLANDCSLT